MTARIVTALLLACILTAAPRTAASSECGDLNGDCSITIRDAFVLLGRVLDFNYEFLCPYVEECPSDASVSEVIEDCFGEPSGLSAHSPSPCGDSRP